MEDGSCLFMRYGNGPSLKLSGLEYGHVSRNFSVRCTVRAFPEARNDRCTHSSRQTARPSTVPGALPPEYGSVPAHNRDSADFRIHTRRKEIRTAVPIRHWGRQRPDDKWDWAAVGQQRAANSQTVLLDETFRDLKRRQPTAIFRDEVILSALHWRD